MRIRVLSFLALLLVAAPAHAVTTYTYTGGGFDDRAITPWSPGTAGVYTTADSVSGSFTVADGFLAPEGGFGRLAVFLGPVITQPGQEQPDGSVSYFHGLVDGVVDWSFTDGHQTLTRANSTATIALGCGGACPPLTDPSIPWPSSFQPGLWEVFIDTPAGGHIHTAGGHDRGDNGFLDASNFGWNVYGTPGTWTVSVAEPMSLLLVLAGIGGVVLARRRLRSRL